MSYQEIPISEIEGLKIGHAQDEKLGTGCTVLLCPAGAPAGVDVRGGGPASRETTLLQPTAAAQEIHAIMLTGGSAFGLDAAAGVMDFLAEKEVGYETGLRKVPLVCASAIFDLIVGEATAAPTPILAYKACEAAWQGDTLTWGNVGVGTGATVGKYRPKQSLMKSGVGAYALQVGELKVGALVCVNAFGDIFDGGVQIAGLLDESGEKLLCTTTEMLRDISPIDNLFTGNTTIGAIITNGKFDKTQLTKIASMGHNGLARAIDPVHTTADGDSLYAMSTGDVAADLNIVGTLGALVVERAIVAAVRAAVPAYGLKTANTL